MSEPSIKATQQPQKIQGSCQYDKATQDQVNDNKVK